MSNSGFGQLKPTVLDSWEFYKEYNRNKKKCFCFSFIFFGTPILHVQLTSFEPFISFPMSFYFFVGVVLDLNDH